MAGPHLAQQGSAGRREPPAQRAGLSFARSPEGIRTLATAVRGRRPGPLDDGAVHCAGTQVWQEEMALLAGGPGLEPRLTEPETVGLPITPYPNGIHCWPCCASRRRNRTVPDAPGGSVQGVRAHLTPPGRRPPVGSTARRVPAGPLVPAPPRRRP